MKNIYVVLGMARGGTSAVARALAAIGVDLGEKLTVADQVWNPTGFWEDNDIVYKINRRLFTMLDEAWMSTRLIDAIKFDDPQLLPLESETMQLLQQRMANSERWGFKDPRTSKLLPFWQPIFAKLHLNENYVIALRNPLSSARSYSHLSGEQLESCLLFWMMHMVAAIEGTHGKQRIIVDYDTILAQPEAELKRLASFCGLEASAKEVNIYANEFLNKKLHRHASSTDEFQDNINIAAMPLAAKIYLLLLRVAQDQININSFEFNTAWQEVMQEFNFHYPLYCYADSILQRTRALNKKVHKIKKSLPWKLVSPLRLVDTLLHNLRNNSREREVKL